MTIPVTICKCSEYDRDTIRRLIAPALEQAFRDSNLSSGPKVLLKPNLIGKYPPEKGATTHPEVVGAVAAMLKDFNAEILIGDSSGLNTNLPSLLTACGLDEVIREYGIKVVEFEQSGIVSLEGASGTTYHFSKIVFDVDTVINLPKMKTHVLTRYTGACKNLFGCIPGIMKEEFHRKAPNQRSFAVVLRDVYGLLHDRVCLHVLDGITGMDGSGPTAGTPAPFNVLISSASGIACDLAAASIFGFKPDTVPHLTGLGVSLNDIDTGHGNDLKEFRFYEANIQNVMHFSRFKEKFPTPLRRLHSSLYWTRPEIDGSKCVGCSICVEKCPMSALEIGNAGTAVLTHAECIKCMCCCEVCPDEAVVIEDSPLLKFRKSSRKVLVQAYLKLRRVHRRIFAAT